MSRLWRFLVAAALVATLAPISAQKLTLSDSDKAEAIQAGALLKGGLTGLVLLDSGQAWANAFSAINRNAYQLDTTNSGFSLRVYTPMAWVEQQASNAAKLSRPFTVSDITEEMLEPVLRVIVYPDRLTQLTASGMSDTSAVKHVVLRDENKQLVFQPISLEPFTGIASSAPRDLAYQGLVAKFPLDEVCQMRGPGLDKAFFIVVRVDGMKETEFKVKPRHFNRLP